MSEEREPQQEADPEAVARRAGPGSGPGGAPTAIALRLNTVTSTPSCAAAPASCG